MIKRKKFKFYKNGAFNQPENCHTLYKHKMTTGNHLEKKRNHKIKKKLRRETSLAVKQKERESTLVGPIFEMVISQHHAI